MNLNSSNNSVIIKLQHFIVIIQPTVVMYLFPAIKICGYIDIHISISSKQIITQPNFIVVSTLPSFLTKYIV